MAPLAKDKIRIMLLEGVHENAVLDLHNAGYLDVEHYPASISEEELIRRIPGVWFLGIRSRTQVTERVLAAADSLVSVGCFCIGTDQVELSSAKRRGIPVFNAPFSNTRSVAELVIGEIIMLMRGIFPKSSAAHEGQWIKSAANSWEVRGKTLGIVGYGNIGTQLSVMAEALGMRVLFFDPVPKLALGQAERVSSLGELLEAADVISLHVPDTLSTQGMIGAEELARMRQGSFLINAARGRVVDVEALADALRRRHLLGAAVDVFPREPKGGDEDFISPLRGIPNVILTPHIGGSTSEAQARIGHEVAQKLIEYSDVGTTAGAVNFPQVQLHPRPSGLRFMHVHRNMPGMLARAVDVFTRRGVNINAQYLETDSDIGYVVMDVEGTAANPEGILNDLVSIEGTIRARFIYERA
ncbi:D-3-phosphoglycerate dehydrogenase [Arboricoccus pini]|uniref:2-oxoglutarate reductase n=1 Tax=Arboricoccus pini TaxID=1963835 RepID=A0A212R8U4_9PROT|nr:phosphoglycerate dehydrogenase [Arboricoccus pini]SNB68437.1 D-3-phosphoglycerate dehydrogenase [Arboricoccus pini]